MYIGLFDGQSGKEAAEYTADHLWTNIQCEGFESCGRDEVKKAVIKGFKKTHKDMWTVRWKEHIAKVTKYVSGFEKRDHFALIVEFELVVLCRRTVDGLSVALCCASE